MAQPDAYIRISTLNDTTHAQRSTEQLGDTLRDALDPDSAEAITEAIEALAAALCGMIQTELMVYVTVWTAWAIRR